MLDLVRLIRLVKLVRFLSYFGWIRLVNPHQVGVSESLISWGGEGGRFAPPLFYGYCRVLLLFFQTGILSWMKRTRIQKHSPLPLKLKPSEFFEKSIFLAKIQNS